MQLLPRTSPHFPKLTDGRFLHADVSLSSLGRPSTDGRSAPAGRAVLLQRQDSTVAAAAPPTEEVAMQLQALLMGLQAPVSVSVTGQVCPPLKPLKPSGLRRCSAADAVSHGMPL